MQVLLLPGSRGRGTTRGKTDRPDGHPLAAEPSHPGVGGGGHAPAEHDDDRAEEGGGQARYPQGPGGAGGGALPIFPGSTGAVGGRRLLPRPRADSVLRRGGGEQREQDAGSGDQRRFAHHHLLGVEGGGGKGEGGRSVLPAMQNPGASYLQEWFCAVHTSGHSCLRLFQKVGV